MSSKSASMDKSSREAKLDQIRKQNQADKRRNGIIAAITGLIILGLAGAVAFVIIIEVQSINEAEASDPSGMVVTANADGVEVNGFGVGPEDADVTVAIFEDFLCPACTTFEQQNGDYIRSLPDEGVQVVFSPVAFLDRASPDEYSSRSASAFACVASTDGDDPTVFQDYSDLLFANQPSEGGAATLDNETLASLAAQVGASDEAQQCIADGDFTGWAGRNTQDAVEAGVSGTPTVWVNGTRVGAEGLVTNQVEIQEAIDAVLGG